MSKLDYSRTIFSKCGQYHSNFYHIHDLFEQYEFGNTSCSYLKSIYNINVPSIYIPNYLEKSMVIFHNLWYIEGILSCYLLLCHGKSVTFEEIKQAVF